MENFIHEIKLKNINIKNTVKMKLFGELTVSSDFFKNKEIYIANCMSTSKHLISTKILR